MKKEITLNLSICDCKALIASCAVRDDASRFYRIGIGSELLLGKAELKDLDHISS